MKFIDISENNKLHNYNLLELVQKNFLNVNVLL